MAVAGLFSREANAAKAVQRGHNISFETLLTSAYLLMQNGHLGTDVELLNTAFVLIAMFT